MASSCASQSIALDRGDRHWSELYCLSRLAQTPRLSAREWFQPAYLPANSYASRSAPACARCAAPAVGTVGFRTTQEGISVVKYPYRYPPLVCDEV
jgi:hypothetical protein